MKGKIGNFTNDSKGTEDAIKTAYQFPNKGHDDYIECFLLEMNRQSLKLRLKKCQFINPHGL